MGKSIRSKRMKHLRTLKREKLGPVDSDRVNLRAEKLNKVIRKEVPAAADVPVIEEEKNPSKERPYTFNFLALKLHQQKEEKIRLANEAKGIFVKKEQKQESEEESEDEMADVGAASPAGRRGRDRSVKIGNASAVLRDLAAQREASGKLLSEEHQKKFHTNLKKSTAPGTTTNPAEERKNRKNRVGNPHHHPQVSDSLEAGDSAMGDLSHISYVETGVPTKVRRGKSAQILREQSRGRSKSKGRAGIVANWHKLA